MLWIERASAFSIAVEHKPTKIGTSFLTNAIVCKLSRSVDQHQLPNTKSRKSLSLEAIIPVYTRIQENEIHRYNFMIGSLRRERTFFLDNIPELDIGYKRRLTKEEREKNKHCFVNRLTINFRLLKILFNLVKASYHQ